MRHMQIPIRELTRLERPALERHFLALEADDRRLRFGAPLNDFAVRQYVARIEFDSDAAFGVFDDDLHLVGAAHLGRLREHAELGVSVLVGHRGIGIGGALLARAHMHARNWGVRALFMHCLTENAAIMRLASKQGMRVAAAAGEADAWLGLPPADASSLFGAVFAQRAALFDYALKQGRSWLAPGK
ncbi:MAG TPA: GNAT family N-acetyltransferase [Burkholderiales bacterium]|nr:GNAT family N-acetyltransferase [Burkholderiales bacterium]